LRTLFGIGTIKIVDVRKSDVKHNLYWISGNAYAR
jgi:hypothetical protein